MCGIVGSVGTPRPNWKERMSSALAMLNHRGPDSTGVWQSDNGAACFGHTRLAIVDLSSSGHQPMRIGDFAITFNGEIYNHVELRQELLSEGVVFQGESDTEVVLRGYKRFGTEYFRKLNGAFAFAIYDPNRKDVVLARDRVGEKPLYIACHRNSFFFSSELKSLVEYAELPKRLTDRAVYNYFRHGYADSASVFYQNVSALQPGRYVRINPSRIPDSLSVDRQRAYWSLPSQSVQERPLYELKEELSSLLEDSVRMQLRCDVPASILLSGGVDSSLLVGLACRATSNVRTFTVKFPGHTAFDESESARKIASFFATDHVEVEGVDISPELLVSIGQKIDIPINDSSLLPTFLVNKTVSNYCKVALGGDGGDELFGGYKHYARQQKLDSLLSNFRPIAKGGARKLQPFFGSRPRVSNWLDYIQSEFSDSSGVIPNIRAFHTKSSLTKLIPSLDPVLFDKDKWGFFNNLSNATSLQVSSFADFNHYLRDSILVKSDRASMLNSIEARAPILDVRIVDFAMRDVPDKYKILSGNKKFILKEVARDFLPPSFDFNRKLGFNLPLGKMIKAGPWKELFGDIISAGHDLIDRNEAQKLFQSHLAGNTHTDRLFGLVLFLIWAKENRI